jgi:hypothetical protein
MLLFPPLISTAKYDSAIESIENKVPSSSDSDNDSLYYHNNPSFSSLYPPYPDNILAIIKRYIVFNNDGVIFHF